MVSGFDYHRETYGVSRGERNGEIRMLSWIGQVARKLQLGNKDSQSANRHSRRQYLHRSRLEQFEVRKLLTAYLVDTSIGTDTGSLPWAVQQANASPGSDTINFAVALADTTITLSAPLELTDTVGTTTIAGLGALHLTISGGDTTQVLHVDADVTAEISDLTISHGRAAAGGAAFNAGTLTISGAVLENSSSGQGGGGAIFNQGQLNISGTTISDNVAGLVADSGSDSGGGPDGGPSGNGGAIYNVGIADLSHCVLSRNVAHGSGGAIFSRGKLTATDSTIEHGSASYGGAIFNDFPAADAPLDGLDVPDAADSTIGGEAETLSNNSAVFGGGIFNRESLSATHVTFQNNAAIVSGGALRRRATQ
jgi:predicted outer membrane repeat protein